MKADTQSSDPRVQCPEERSKVKVVGNYLYTSALMRERLKLFRAIVSVNQLSIYEQSQICVKNTVAVNKEQGRLVVAEQSDPLLVPKNSLIKTPAPSTDDPAQEDLLQKYLLLRADQRLKQNHKDVLLPAHLQKQYPLEKESGLILSQKIIRQSLTQYQNN